MNVLLDVAAVAGGVVLAIAFKDTGLLWLVVAYFSIKYLFLNGE